MHRLKFIIVVTHSTYDILCSENTRFYVAFRNFSVTFFATNIFYHSLIESFVILLNRPIRRTRLSDVYKNIFLFIKANAQPFIHHIAYLIKKSVELSVSNERNTASKLLFYHVEINDDKYQRQPLPCIRITDSSSISELTSYVGLRGFVIRSMVRIRIAFM